MNRDEPFADREDAGRLLADELQRFAGTDPLVLGLPRGGVPVAAHVAAGLGAPLDVVVVRKLGFPTHPELAMGAIAGVGDAIEVVRNEPVLQDNAVPEDEFDRVRQSEETELRRRETAYRGDRPAAAVTGRAVIVVDDGLATGSTMRAAIAALRRQQPEKLVVAVPVASERSCAAVGEEVDEMVCLWMPEPFFAVGQAYRDFAPTSDEDVARTLSTARAPGQGG